VGYNYSVLGNWPLEPIRPNPDYYTTVLFRRLFGDTVLATAAVPSAPGAPATNDTEGGDRARAFAFCAAGARGAAPVPAPAVAAGAVSIALINFDPRETATFTFDSGLGPHQDYVLAPGADPLVADAPWSSRQMLLNGERLQMHGPAWDLPGALAGAGPPPRRGGVVLPPLHVAFTVFPSAGFADCK